MKNEKDLVKNKLKVKLNDFLQIFSGPSVHISNYAMSRQGGFKTRPYKHLKSVIMLPTPRLPNPFFICDSPAPHEM